MDCPRDVLFTSAGFSSDENGNRGFCDSLRKGKGVAKGLTGDNGWAPKEILHHVRANTEDGRHRILFDPNGLESYYSLETRDTHRWDTKGTNWLRGEDASARLSPPAAHSSAAFAG